MFVYKITPKEFASNCYLVTENNKNAILIDAGADEIFAEAERLKLKIEYVILTHGHFDHIKNCKKLQSQGAKIGCLKEELAVINSWYNLGGVMGDKVEPFNVDFTFSDNDELNLCGIKIKVMATAGHTVGGATFIIEDALFTGDTLFCESVGRCDFPTGNKSDLMKSVKKILALTKDYKIHTGHGEDTTLINERNFNPYIK